MGVENLPFAVAVFEGENVDFFFLVAAPGFLAAVGFHFGVFVPFVAGFQVVGSAVVAPGYAFGFEVFDAVNDPSAASRAPMPTSAPLPSRVRRGIWVR